MLGDALEDVAQIALRVDPVQLGRAQQRVHHCRRVATRIRADVEVVFSADRYATQGALSRIVVCVDASVTDEVRQRRPVVQGIADRQRHR